MFFIIDLISLKTILIYYTDYLKKMLFNTENFLKK
ncbi:hypothetical protein NT05LM_1768, partial [Listeria marthii FSL S4-120]